MNPEIMECYLEAGKIASKVRQETIRTVEAGARLLDTAEYAEELVNQMGGNMAFPCNISVNEVASHYVPINGRQKFEHGDVVKLDIGVHIDGYIADTASTIEVDTHQNHILIKAAREALDAAIAQIREGVNTKHLGSVMEKVIRSYGCRPVVDLTGHSIDRYIIHSGVNIPNYSGAVFGYTLHAGDVVAVEPFTTQGRGKIKRGEARIFGLLPGKNVSSPVYDKLESRFHSLPFTKRWIEDPGELEKINLYLRKYPVLIERDGCPVAQAEHTVIVQEDSCMVITA